jgi:hypothetical protein
MQDFAQNGESLCAKAMSNNGKRRRNANPLSRQLYLLPDRWERRWD